MCMLIQRALHELVRQRLRAIPTVVLFGPRQVGKTTLAHALAAEWEGRATYEVSAPTISAYIDLLVDLLLVRLLPPWSGNLAKRLVRTPTEYVRDSGVLHALLGLGTLDDVLGHPVVGASWEGFVIEQLIAAAGPQRQAMFFRTAAGAEADLVFEKGGTVEMVIEIKRSSAPSVSAGLRVACDDLSPVHAYVVHGGDGRWPMGQGITAVSLLEMVQILSTGDQTL